MKRKASNVAPKASNVAPKAEKRHAFRFGSALGSAASGVSKLVFAAVEQSVFVSVSGFYALAVAFSKAVALKGEFTARGDRKKERKFFLTVAATLAAASAFDIVYSARLFFYPEAFRFDKIAAIGIAALSFSELIVASVRLSRARRRGDLLDTALRCINLSSAFSAIALTETALLALGTQGADVSIPSAAGGVAFGALSLAIALAALFRCLRLRRAEGETEKEKSVSAPPTCRGGKRKVKNCRSTLTRVNLRVKLSLNQAKRSRNTTERL